MNELISPLLSFVLLYKYWALFTLGFFAAFAFPFPMNTIFLATGAFASQGYFDLSFSFMVTIGANIVGDYAGYTLARIYGNKILKTLHVKLPSNIERFDHHMRNHAGITIFLTRFVGVLGTTANLFSGFIGVSVWKFLLYDFLGNIVSVGGAVYLGYYLGEHWEDFSGFISIISWAVIGLVLMAALIYWYVKKGRK